MSTTIQAGPYTYEWIEDWAKLPPASGFAHHGVAIAPDGSIYTGDATEPRIHVLSPQGNLLQSFDLPVSEVHGISFGTHEGTACLFVVDTGNKPVPPRKSEGMILRCSLDGDVQQSFGRKDLGYRDDEGFSPTACAQDPETGNLWIADGYGSSRVHCIQPDGTLVLHFDGSNSETGPLKTPHWIWVDQRQGNSRIYVADRSNDRVLVYAPDGTLLKNLDKGFDKPSGFASFGDTLVVAELSAGIVLLDKDDNRIGPIGTNREALKRPGWPNAKNEEDKGIRPTEYLTPGLFNSPHGIAADKNGNIYVSEWLFGGRYICLKRI